MKIEYDGICANVLRCNPLLCKKCAFFQNCMRIDKPCFTYIDCGLNGLEKDSGYIFKV